MATAHMKAPPSTGRFHLGGWTVDPMRNRLVGARGEEHVHPKAMEVLVLLAERAGEVVSRDAFLATVWNDTFVSDQVLANAIWELRRALDDDPRAPRFIATVPKRGYRLLAPVESGEIEERSGERTPATSAEAPLPAPMAEDGPRQAPADPACGDRASDQPPSAREGAADAAEKGAAEHGVAAAEAAAGGRSGSRRLVFAAGLLLAGLLLVGVFLVRDALERRSTQPAGAEGESLVVAILPFENSTGDAGLDWLAAALPDVLTHELASSRHLYVLDAVQRAGTAVDGGDARRSMELARRRGAQVLISGRLTGGDGRLRVYSRFDAAEAGPRHFEVVAAEATELFQKLADELRLALEIEAVDEDATAISATGTSSIDAYRRYIQGLQLARRQDHRGALVELHAAVELDPEFALAHGELAHVYDVQGEQALAEQAVSRALELADGRGQAERIGLLRLQARIAGELGSELEYLRQMVALRPRDARWIATLGWFQYTHFRQCDEAIVRYRQALALDPRPDLHAYLGEACMACGRPGEAVEALEQALELQPENAETWRFLGYLRLLAGDVEGAGRSIERASELAPSRAGVAFTRALWLSARRRYEEALEALRLARGLATGVNPERDGWVAEADVHRLAGDLDAAARAAAQALALGAAPEALWIAGLVALERGRVAEAEKSLAALEDHFAASESRYGVHFREHLRGEIQMHEGRPREAVRAFTAAVEARPLEQAPFRLALAEAWLEVGDAEEAAGVLYRLLEIQPNHIEARCLAARAHEHEGRVEAARLERRACEALRAQLD